MLVAQYNVGIKQGRVDFVSVHGVMLEECAILTCDLELRLTGNNLILGLAYLDDVAEGVTTPYEWVMLPNLNRNLEQALRQGQRVRLIEEINGDVFELKLTDTQEVAI